MKPESKIPLIIILKIGLDRNIAKRSIILAVEWNYYKGVLNFHEEMGRRQYQLIQRKFLDKFQVALYLSENECQPKIESTMLKPIKKVLGLRKLKI